MTLSDKFPYNDMEYSKQWIKIEDIKEAIKELKEEFALDFDISAYDLNEAIDKIFGKGLVE